MFWMVSVLMRYCVCFCKQKTAYEMRISDWSSDVCSSDLQVLHQEEKARIARVLAAEIPDNASRFIDIGTTTEQVANALVDHKGLRVITNNLNEIRRASCRDRACQYV